MGFGPPEASARQRLRPARGFDTPEAAARQKLRHAMREHFSGVAVIRHVKRRRLTDEFPETTPPLQGVRWLLSGKHGRATEGFGATLATTWTARPPDRTL